MNQEQKAQAYGELLNEHTRVGNRISEIKGQDIEMNKEQLKKIQELENRQVQIMYQINKLMS
jgi:hypothetical protein